MERKILMREKEELRIKNEVLKKEKEELEEGKVELKKYMEGFLIEKMQFWKEKELEKEKEDEDLEGRDQGNGEVDVQHSDALDVNTCEKSLRFIPVYKRRSKRAVKSSVYEHSPFTFIFVIQTTPSNAADYEKLRELCSPIKMIDEETLNHMKMGPKQRRAHKEEFGDEAEEESGDEEDDEEQEEDKEEGEEEVEDTDREPPVTRSKHKSLDALSACMARIEENEGNLKRRLKKLSHTMKAILCYVHKEGAPPPSSDSEDY
ncbi:uncharacterized protein LOC131228816 [Magnolia sinica]|uniref:uncharacterized protein LOC131228816 n=1 Tax=Magnolia sinica TaxID=86752 RepID=UPI00265A95EF|nr:uncharacterized protein LOC131228816 [Magnolia sinica]